MTTIVEMTRAQVSTLSERFDSFVHPEALSGCWLWHGAVNPAGYGIFSVRQKSTLAHRVSWLLHRGPIANRLHVLHRCDVRACVNPDHLFLGTDGDNMRDMSAKGRGRGNVRLGRRTHCANGHPFTGEMRADGGRRCRECVRTRRVRLAAIDGALPARDVKVIREER